MIDPHPQLSIIVPTLNEAKNIPLLIQDLSRQCAAPAFELIIADGGSDDSTISVAKNASVNCGIPFKAVKTQVGRGRQMNAAVSTANGDDLLFLHADTHLSNPQLLKHAKDKMVSLRNKKVAGHFSLRFEHSATLAAQPYFFYETKTHLNREGCINGDQGIWLSRRYFNELGGFDESLPYMEDARLARKIFFSGTWVTLPGTLITSPRRFEKEGLIQRQILNALLSNFDYIGLFSFFDAAANAYQAQQRTQKLRLKPFLYLAHKLSLADGVGNALVRWYRTGGYVAKNAWQLALAIDCINNRRNGLVPGAGQHKWLIRYDRWLAPVITSVPGYFFVAVLTCAWFYALLLHPYSR